MQDGNMFMAPKQWKPIFFADEWEGRDRYFSDRVSAAARYKTLYRICLANIACFIFTYALYYFPSAEIFQNWHFWLRACGNVQEGHSGPHSFLNSLLFCFAWHRLFSSWQLLFSMVIGAQRLKRIMKLLWMRIPTRNDMLNAKGFNLLFLLLFLIDAVDCLNKQPFYTYWIYVK